MKGNYFAGTLIFISRAHVLIKTHVILIYIRVTQIGENPD